MASLSEKLVQIDAHVSHVSPPCPPSTAGLLLRLGRLLLLL